MNNEFKNLSMQEALTNLKADRSHENLLAAAEALLNTKVMIPAKWDKEPAMDEFGQLRFDPDTKVSLMVIQGDTGMRFFPAFTEMEEVKKFYKENQVTCLILSLDQYLPFVKAAGEDVFGIVVDPMGVNVPFKADFLEGIANAQKQRLNQNTIHKGENVRLKNTGKDAEEMETVLISTGFHEKDIRRIFLKERMDDLENPEKSHWFVVIDSDRLDTGIFSRIGQAARKASHGKDIEFMFTDQKLGQDVARTSKPIYERV